MFACLPPAMLRKDVVHHWEFTTGDLLPSAGPGFTQVPQTITFVYLRISPLHVKHFLPVHQTALMGDVTCTLQQPV